MSTTSSPTQSEMSKGSLPVRKPLVEVLAINPADLKDDVSQSARLWLRKRAPLALALTTFCFGVAATWAWLSYGGAARQTIASSSPQLSWLAPEATPVARNTSNGVTPDAPASPSHDQQQFDAISLDLDAVRQSIDRIVARQEQMARNVDQLTAGQEQMGREITKLQAIEQQIRRNNSEPPPRPASTPAPRHVPRR